MAEDAVALAERTDALVDHGDACLALATVGVLEKMLFGLAPHDSSTFLAAMAVLTAVAVVAGYLPARRAMRVDPMAALRYE